jgi:Acyl-CoA dehydrogenases
MTISFSETEEQSALRDAVKALASKYGREYIEKQAREGGKTTELWQDMGKHGFLGVNIPEEYGGGGGGMSDLALVLEETTAAGAPLLMMVVSQAICGSIITRCGTEEQKQTWLPKIASGEVTMAFGITEADAGSNSHKITTTATKDGDAWVLKGQKTFISGVDEAQQILIVSRTADAKTGNLKPALFVVPTDAPGFTKTVIPMAWSAPEKQFTLFLDDVRLPHDALIGDEDGGLWQLFAGLNPSASWGRRCPAASPVTRSTGVAYAKDRRSGRTSRSAPTRASRTRWRRSRSSSSRLDCCGRRPPRSTTPATTSAPASTPTWPSMPAVRSPAMRPTSRCRPTGATA